MKTWILLLTALALDCYVVFRLMWWAYLAWSPFEYNFDRPWVPFFRLAFVAIVLLLLFTIEGALAVCIVRRGGRVA